MRSPGARLWEQWWSQGWTLVRGGLRDPCQLVEASHHAWPKNSKTQSRLWRPTLTMDPGEVYKGLVEEHLRKKLGWLSPTSFVGRAPRKSRRAENSVRYCYGTKFFQTLAECDLISIESSRMRAGTWGSRVERRWCGNASVYPCAKTMAEEVPHG